MTAKTKRPVEQRLMLNTVGPNRLDAVTLIKLMWYEHSWDEAKTRAMMTLLLEEGGLTTDDSLVCRGKD